MQRQEHMGIMREFVEVDGIDCPIPCIRIRRGPNGWLIPEFGMASVEQILCCVDDGETVDITPLPGNTLRFLVGEGWTWREVEGNA